MIPFAAALTALVLPLTAGGHVSGELTPNRVVTMAAHTAAGASCTLHDALTGLRLRRATSSAGRATWRWRPPVWANGPDTVSIRCAKGAAHGSTEYFLILGEVEQISVIRDYALHLVYWAPAGDVPAAVAPAVSQLESDVKASLDAGAVDNPFAIPRAYGDDLGGGDPRIASIDSTLDTRPYPKPSEEYCPAAAACLGSPDITAEVSRVAQAHGWAAGNRSLVAVFTSPSLTVCYTRAPCTRGNEICGYHALTRAGFAYAEIVMSATQCERDPAAFAIRTLEHEQDEVVVDPWGYGLEVADPCEHDSKAVAINGHTYDLQSILDNGVCAFAFSP